MASFTMLLLASPLAVFVSSEPTISFPFNSQLPPAARIGELYSYEFSPYTFKADGSLSYSLGDAPRWMSLDSQTRRLHGTPKEDDVPPGQVVGQSVEILADDGSGIASLNATLVVSRNAAPKVKVPISEQMEKFGDYSAPSSLLSYPSTDFSYTFDANTFDQESGDLNYYATSDNSSPLPAWVKFDAQSLTFSGKTPSAESLIQPPQTFGFRLAASDIVGFSAVSVSFSIVVGRHKLATTNPVIELNATRGEKFSYDKVADGIQLDNKAVKLGNLQALTVDIPKWLSIDPATFKLEGTPGAEDHSTNFTMQFRDQYLDTLDITYVVNVATGLFRSTFDGLRIRAGDEVDEDLRSHFWDPDNIELSMETDPKEDWLKLEGFKLRGRVPKSATQAFKVSFTASSKNSDIKETETLKVTVLAATDPTSSNLGTVTASVTASSNPTGSSEPSADRSKSSHHKLTTGEILLATIIPIVCFILLMMLLCCCLVRRRRSRQSYISSSFRSKISGPVSNSLRVNGKPAMQHTDKDFTIGKTGYYMHRPAMQGYDEVQSGLSDSSLNSLDRVETPQLPSNFIAESMRGRSKSTTTADDERKSWVTVEGTEAVMTTTRRSVSSSRSDTTISESTHQLIPPMSFSSEAGSGSFRNGLEMAIPSLKDLPKAQADSSWQRGHDSLAGTSSGLYSTTNGSSLAFSSSHLSSPRLLTGLFGRKASSSTSNARSKARDGAVALDPELSECVSELRRPNAAQLSSQQRLSRRSSRPWTAASSNANKSLVTNPSFGSQENWRVLSTYGPPVKDSPSLSYQQLVKEVPFNPARQSEAMTEGREGAMPGERSSTELMSPSIWDNSRTSIRASSNVLGISTSRETLLGPFLGKSGSKMSKLGQEVSAKWKSEEPGKSSNGSFAAFL